MKIKYEKINNVNKFKLTYLKLLRGLNKYTGIFNNKLTSGLLSQIYYPKEQREAAIALINSEKYDIVIACEGYYSMLLAVIDKEINCKTIGWEHNSFDAYLNTKYKYYWNRDQLFKKYSRNLDKHIVLTENDKNKFKNILDIDTQVIYNPISFRSKEKSDVTNKEIISIGRFTSQKGLDNLLKSFKIMNEKCNGWTLKLYGDGEDRGLLTELTKELGLKESVKFYPFTNNVIQAIKTASIYAMSSRWEGFGLVVTEALELGVPVVTFNTTGPSEIIGKYKCGIIVEQGNIKQFAEALIYLAENSSKRIEYSKNAIDRAKYFNEDNIAKEWKKYFEELLEE